MEAAESAALAAAAMDAAHAALGGGGGLLEVPGDPGHAGMAFGGGMGGKGVAPESVGFLVSNDRVPRVIGKAGAGLRQIREACGMKVEAKPEVSEGELEPATCCRLTLAGTPDQICVAFQVALTRAWADEPNATAMIRIPAEFAGRTIGKGGENLRKVRTLFNVNAQVGRDRLLHPLTRIEERPVTLEGPTSQLPQALGLLLQAGNLEPRRQGFSAGGAPPVGPMLPAAGMAGLAAAPGGQALPGAMAMSRQSTLGGGPSSPDEVCLHLAVADSMAGAVLGKAGATIKEMSAKAGCKLRMTSRVEGSDEPRRVVIVGSMEAVAIAQTLLNSQLCEAYVNEGHPEPTAFAITMWIRKEACGAVIFRQGAGIQGIRDRTGTKITLRSDGEIDNCRPCLIEGPLPSVLAAERLIHEVQRQVPMADGGGGGSGGQKRAAPDYGGPAVPDMIGGQAQGVFAAANALVKRPRTDGGFEEEPETRLLVPEQTVGLVIGKQGGNLKTMRERYGVRVDVKKPEEAPNWSGERLVIFRGPTHARAMAVEHSLRATQAHSSQAGLQAQCCKVLVPASKVGHVVGEGGSIFRWLSENFSVHPSIGSVEVNGEYLFSVRGAPSAVLEAAKQIVGLLDVDAQKALNDPQQLASQQQYGGGGQFEEHHQQQGYGYDQDHHQQQQGYGYDQASQQSYGWDQGAGGCGGGGGGGLGHSQGQMYGGGGGGYPSHQGGQAGSSGGGYGEQYGDGPVGGYGDHYGAPDGSMRQQQFQQHQQLEQLQQQQYYAQQGGGAAMGGGQGVQQGYGCGYGGAS